MLERKIFIFILAVFSTVNNYSQIIAPVANDSVIASYDTDKVFIFNKPFFNSVVSASITAVSPDANERTFSWAIYSPADSGYTSLAGSPTGHMHTIDTITVSSGYRVIMSNGLDVDTFRVWIIMNNLEVMITNKTESDTLSYGYYDCSSLDLHADTIRPPAFYYDPFTNLKLEPGNIYTIRWTSDNVSASNPAGRLLTRVYDPPWQDTRYTITITDRFGLIRTDDVVYKSVQSKAVISTPAYIPPGDTLLNIPYRDYREKFYNYDEYVSAPALYKFDLSGSQNFADFELDFGDGDSILGTTDSLILFHEFKKPGLYKVVLTTRSDPPFQCTDSVSAADINVDYASEANFIMPNVFTPSTGNIKPDENSINDLFRTTDVSVFFIEIAIYTRTGLKVHEYIGNIRDWEGWDGSLMHSGEAPEGVYFYVITYLGAYQDSRDKIRNKHLQGFIHLYRH